MGHRLTSMRVGSIVTPNTRGLTRIFNSKGG